MKENDTNEPHLEHESAEPEEVDIEEGEGVIENKVKKLRQELKRSSEEKKKLQDDLQRLRADYLNSKRRLEKDSGAQVEKQIVKDIQKLLPLSDSFTMAMSDEKVWHSVDENWRKGIEGIHSQLESILSSYNVQKLLPEGEQFNPEHHQAVTNIPVDDPSQNSIVQSVIQAGYIRKVGEHEILVRPATVTVGVYEEKE